VSRLFEALRNAADGAFVIDEDLRIIFWNKAAEAMLGFDSNDVIGRPCYHLLNGYDDGRQLICNARCQVLKLAMKAKPVPNYDIHVKTKQGDNCWLNMSIFTYKMNETNGKKVIVHLFHDLINQEFDDKVLDRLVKVINRYHDIRYKNGGGSESYKNTLTSREREVLTLLAEGYGTQDIAQTISVSTSTVRNHIQHVLQKLQVHTRLEAVALASKHNLID